MATAAGEGTSYEGGGGGAGGKFRKKPFRKPHTTPYDRPPVALRNPTTNGWLSRIVDPASKLITASAHLFFSSFSRKRLPPPPPPPPEANGDSSERFHEAVLDNPPGVQGTTINDGGKPTNSLSSGGLSELEQILKQKTFTRSEVDRLTELLRSRSVDLPNGDMDKRNELNLLQPESRDLIGSSRMQENQIEKHLQNHRFHGCISTPIVSSPVLEEDIAAPAELAKAYMGSKPSKVSSSMLGLASQALRQDASLLNNVSFPPSSPVMSLVPKPTLRAGVPENGFITPRSRGRSAIYSMARTPYSRFHPTATQKGTSSTYDGSSGQPASSSSSQLVWDHDPQYSSNYKHVASKRRSSVLEDNIGSVGPIRRLRQKTNLSTPKNLGFPISQNPFSSRGNGIGPGAAQFPTSSAQKQLSLHEPKHKISRTVGENEDNSMPGTSYAHVPSKSTEMATKILQQLENLVPKEKSPEGKVPAAREKSQSMLTPKILSGGALRSLEDVNSSKILHNAEDSQKLKDMRNISSPDARDTSSRKQDKVEENGPKRLIISHGSLAPAGINKAIVSVKEAVHAVNPAHSVSTQFPIQPSQKKWGFQMSAHEDFLELDDEIHSNKAAATHLAEVKEISEVSLVEGNIVFPEAVTVDKTSTVPEFQTVAGPLFGKSADFGTYDGTVTGEKKSGRNLPTATTSSTTFQLVTGSPKSPSAFDKIVPAKEANAPPLFSFGSKNVDEIPSLTFPSSSSVTYDLKSSAPLEPKPGSSNSLINVTSSGTDILSKIPECDKGEDKNKQKSGDAVGRSEIPISSAISASTSTSKIFSFGEPAKSSSLSNGSLDSSPSIFSSPSPVLASSNITSQTFANSFMNVAASTAATITTNGSTAAVSASNSSQSTSATAPSFPAASIFKFGSIPERPTDSVSTVSATSNAETTDSKAKTEKETAFGNLIRSPFGGTSFAMPSTGSSIFGFSASAAANNLSKGPLFGSNGSMVSKQASSASSPAFRTSEITSFTSSSSLFGASTSSTSIFGSSTSSSSLFGLSTPKVIDSSTGFGSSSSASLSETNSAISSGPTSSLLGSTWQPPKPSVFGSNTACPSTGFSFGGPSISGSPSTAATNSAPVVFGSSTGGASSGSVFSFTSASATAPCPTLPVFGSSVPGFTTASGNGDQMSMEDSMAEDPVQASASTISVFGQPPNSISIPPATPTMPVFGQPPNPTFAFGSAAPSAGQPFQFGSQQNPSTPQNPPPFQASSSLGFGAGGSFSLGSGGDDKANRRILKVKHKVRRR